MRYFDFLQLITLVLVLFWSTLVPSIIRIETYVTAKYNH